MSPFKTANIWINRVTRGKVAQSTSFMMVGGAATLLLQAVYFITIARSLGSGQYGAFVGTAALIAVLTPFSALGVGNVLVKNVARNRERLAESWGNAILAAAVLSLLLLAVAVLLSPIVLSNRAPVLLVFLIGVSDLIFGGLVGLVGQIFQAFELLGATARVTTVLSGARAVAALVMLTLVPSPDAVSWALFYLGSSVLGATYALTKALRQFGSPRIAPRRLLGEIREGLYFSVGISSQSIYNNIDKTMLVRFGTLEATGLYGLAYRLIDLAFQPVGALQSATYARFFQHGARGIHQSVGYSRRFLFLTVCYSVFVGLVLLFAAPILPWIFGRQFAGADSALRWLSPIVLFRSVHYFLSNSLTGADFQGLRSGIQVIVATLNVGLNFLLIPTYSWHGAAWASLASDGMLAVGMVSAILFLQAKTQVHEPGRKVQTESST